MRTPRLLLAALALAAIPFVAPSAHADEGAADPAKDPQVARLLQAKKTLNWNHVLGSNSDRYGHAEALVEATPEQLAKTATEFGKYRELHRKFKTARVIGKEGDQTDVYMRYPVQIGPMTIELYEVERLDFADAYLVASAESTGVGIVASFDRSLDRVGSVRRDEPA